MNPFIDSFLFLLNLVFLIYFGYKTVSFFLENLLEKIISLHILIWANLLLTCVVLSLFQQLNNPYLYFILSSILMVYFSYVPKKYNLVSKVNFKNEVLKFKERNFKFFKKDIFSLFLFSTFLLMSGVLFFLCINYYPRNLDYTREVLLGLLIYIQDGSLLTSDSVSPFSITFSFPYNGLLYNSIFAIYKQSHHYFLLTSFINWLVCSFSIYLISRKIGASKRGSLIASYLLMMSQPVVITGSMEMNDIQVYSSVLVGLVFVFDFLRTKKIFYALMIGLSWGLSFGTKYLIGFFLLGFIIFFCYFLFSKIRRSIFINFIKENQKAIFIGLFASILMMTPEIQKYLLHKPHKSFQTITKQHESSVSPIDARIVQKQSVLYGTLWGYFSKFSITLAVKEIFGKIILFHLDFFLSPLINIFHVLFGDNTLISKFFLESDKSLRSFISKLGIVIPDPRAPFLRPDHSPVTYLMIHSLYSYPIYMAIFLLLFRRIKNEKGWWLVIFYLSFLLLFSLLKAQDHHIRYVLTSFFVVAPIIALLYDKKDFLSSNKKMFLNVFFLFLSVMTFLISWRSIVSGPYKNSYRANQVRSVLSEKEHNLNYYKGYVKQAFEDADNINIFFNNIHHYTDMMRRSPYKKYTLLGDIVKDKQNFFLLPPAYQRDPYVWQYNFFPIPVYTPFLKPDEGYIFLDEVSIKYNMFVNNLKKVDYSLYPKPRYLMFAYSIYPRPKTDIRDVRMFLMKPLPKTKIEIRLLIDVAGPDKEIKRIVFDWVKDKYTFPFAVGPDVKIVYLQIRKYSPYEDQQIFMTPILLHPKSIDVRKYIQKQ